MVNAQAWLDKKYPVSERKKITELNIQKVNTGSFFRKKRKLQGTLKLEGFSNLKSFCCKNNQLTNLDISDCSQLEELNCADNELVTLDVGKNHKLVKLDCGNNSLTSLDLSSLLSVREINCSNNLLVEVIFPEKAKELINKLKLQNNNLSERELSFFENFVGLEELWIGSTDEEKLGKGIYDHFRGSIWQLQGLKKLRILCALGKNIEGGSYYEFDFPWKNSLGEIYSEENKNSEINEIFFEEEEAQEGGEEDRLSTYCYSFDLDDKSEGWSNIHSDFVKGFAGQKYQKIWENDYGFTYKEAKKWIKAGFVPSDYEKIQDWKNIAFAPSQVREWLTIGLEKGEYEFASYLREHNCNPKKAKKHVTSFRITYNKWLTSPPAQEYFDLIYPKRLKKNGIKEIMIYDKNLTGSLSIQDFPDLETIDCSGNKITSLVILNCPGVLELSCLNNEIAKCDFLDNLDPIRLSVLRIGHNNLKSDLNIFSKFLNLNILEIQNNEFYGSLESLKECSKLEVLDISDINVDSGLELLPKSLKNIWCTGQLSTELKANKRGTYYDYQTWKALEQESKKIEGLEDDIVRLANLTNEQRKKIVTAYLRFAPEKELLKELIIISYEFSKFKKKCTEDVDYNAKCEEYETKCWEAKEKLKQKVANDQEIMNDVRNTINDCETLVQWELELESEIIKRKLLLDDAYQKVLSLTININERIELIEGNVYIGNIMKAHNEMSAYQPNTTNFTEMMERIEKENYEKLVIKSNLNAPINSDKGNIIVSSKIESGVDLSQNKQIVNSIVDVKGDVQVRDFVPQVSNYQAEVECSPK